MANRYKVHSCHETSIEVDAVTSDGVKVQGKMPYAIIELLPVEARDHATLPWREPMATKEDVEFVRATFPVGGIVEIGDFALFEAPPEAPKEGGAE